MVKRNLRDFLNDVDKFNGTLIVPKGANFDNVGDEQNDLVPDIDDDHDVPYAGVNSDEFT